MQPAKSIVMEREAIVVYADNDPVPGVSNPGPNQRYRNPQVKLERRPLGPLASDCIRVQMLYGGICGTDLHLLQTNSQTGYIETSSPAIIPAEGRIIGHEGIGRVLEVSHGGDQFSPGDFVAFESIVACQRCDCCRRGLLNQCRDSQLLGMEQDGLFSAVVDVPASVAHNVSSLTRNDRDAQCLAGLEPASVALLACQKARLSSRDRVVIFGAGPIGVYCAILARVAFAAGPIELVEPVKFRREFSRKWADRVYSPEEFFQTDGRGVDVVIEASGDMRNVENVVRMIDAAGRIVLLGRTGQPLVISGVDHIITNAVSIIGSRGHLGGAFDTILKLYSTNRFDPAAVVTNVVEGMKGLHELLHSPEQVIQNNCKVLVRFSHGFDGEDGQPIAD